MRAHDPAKIAAAKTLWLSMKSRARITRRPAMTGEACTCFISDKQAAYLRSLCQRANMEHPSSQDTFALEMGVGLALSPAKFGFRCEWQEFPELVAVK